MSGIVGILDVGGRAVESGEIDRMLTGIAHRGPDGQNQWVNQSIGLGHCMLQTTPESLHEHLPLNLNHLTITADARIDNREELFGALGIEATLRAQMTDSELILHAYRMWGTDCVDRLLGDFVFAVWDEEQRRLFCARDHFGMKPFYYYGAGNRFIFASEIQAILAVLPSRPAIREQTIIDWILYVHSDKTYTFFEGIKRLPPAHFILLDTQGNHRLQEYWRLEPEREIHLGSDDEYVEQFRELFTEAVRCRLRSAFPVGTTLSGGLDSSSVTCMTRNLLGTNRVGVDPLPTFSAVMPDVPESNEEQYQQIVVNAGGIKPYTFRGDQVSPLSPVYEMLDHLGQPIDGGNEFIDWYTLKLAHQHSVRVLLNGLDGDNTVSHGDALMRELALNGDWPRFHRETALLAARSNISEGRVRDFNIQGHVLPTFHQLVEERQWLRALTHLYQMNEHFGYSKRKFAKATAYLFWPKATLRFGSLIKHRQIPSDYETIFNSETIRHYNLRGKVWPANVDHGTVTGRQFHFARLTSGLLTRALEETEAKAAAFSIDARSPFCDKRLLEYCLALPPDQKMQNGWTRSILRRAMDGILPPEIRDRLTKADLQPNFNRGLAQQDSKQIEFVKDNLSRLMPFINEQVFSANLDNYLQDGKAEYEARVWRVVSVGIWLQYQNQKRK